MNECFKCGVSGERAELYNAISSKGIVKICRDCASIEKMPIIRKPTNDQIAEAQRHKTVQERLAGMNRGKLRTEVTLRDLVDKNLKAGKNQSNPSDLTDNFHWTIQRIRRARKITREQFAKGIGESDATVRMIEQGFFPENNYRIINKIESFLGIRLRKPGTSEFSQEKPYRLDNSLISESDKKLAFNENTTKRLKISDLRDMKRQKKEEKQPIDSWEEQRDEDGNLIENEDFEDEER